MGRGRGRGRDGARPMGRVRMLFAPVRILDQGVGVGPVVPLGGSAIPGSKARMAGPRGYETRADAWACPKHGGVYAMQT